MNKIQEAILNLNARIAEINLEDEEDLCQYIQLASRMKALGDSKAFDKIPEIFKKDEFKNIDEILSERCKRGIWDIDEQDGEELGLTLIEAQDFKIFYEFTKDQGLYSAKTGVMFERWLEETKWKMIDEKTESVLTDWIDMYPIPEDLRLPVVDSPVTEWDYELLGTIAGFLPRNIIHGTWKAQ